MLRSSLIRQVTSVRLLGTKRLPKKTLSLEEFLFRKRLLSVYRLLLRAINKSHEKDDLRRFVKDEFTINNKETDLNHRKYLLTIGIGRINDMLKQMGIGSRDF